jgi:hypothetical protein
MNVEVGERGRAVSYLGIYKSDLLCSAVSFFLNSLAFLRKNSETKYPFLQLKHDVYCIYITYLRKNSKTKYPFFKVL